MSRGIQAPNSCSLSEPPDTQKTEEKMEIATDTGSRAMRPRNISPGDSLASRRDPVHHPQACDTGLQEMENYGASTPLKKKRKTDEEWPAVGFHVPSTSSSSLSSSPFPGLGNKSASCQTPEKVGCPVHNWTQTPGKGGCHGIEEQALGYKFASCSHTEKEACHAQNETPATFPQAQVRFIEATPARSTTYGGSTYSEAAKGFGPSCSQSALFKSGLRGPAGRLRRGVVVRIHGTTHSDLNGTFGLCLGQGVDGRWIVQLDTERGEKNLLPKNLRVVALGGATKATNLHGTTACSQTRTRSTVETRIPSTGDIIQGMAALECEALRSCSDEDERRTAKKRLLLKWHPDKAPTSAGKDIAKNVMQAMQDMPLWQE